MTPEAADRIDALLARQSGRAAVVVAGGRSGEMLYAVDADEPVFAASLYKLGVLLEVERRIDAGTLQPSDLITVTRPISRRAVRSPPRGACSPSTKRSSAPSCFRTTPRRSR